MKKFQREREILLWFTTQKITTSTAGSIQTWEPELHLGAVAQVIGLSSTAFPSHHRGANLEVEQRGLAPASIQDAATTGSVLMLKLPFLKETTAHRRERNHDHIW